MVISLLKEVFTVPEICALFQVQKETYPLEISYDYFCTEFENALRETFSPTGNPLPMVATAETDQTVLVRPWYWPPSTGCLSKRPPFL